MTDTLKAVADARKAKIEGLPTDAELKKLKEQEAQAFAEFQAAAK